MNRDAVCAFRERLAREAVYGPFSKTEDPAFVECMGLAGFDFCIIDLEHGPNTIRSAQHLVRAAELSGMLPIIRLPEDSRHRIGAALDIGAAGVQIPQITTAAEAADAVRKARYAPAGMRGVCRYVRNAGYGSTPKADYFAQANDALVIVQLEGRSALDHLDAILNTVGIDIVFVGPYDLSQSLGVTGETSHPSVIGMVERIVAACRARGLAAGTFVESPEDARRWEALGVHYLCYSVDVGIFLDSCRVLRQRLAE